jgi:hypothetical protein
VFDAGISYAAPLDKEDVDTFIVWGLEVHLEPPLPAGHVKVRVGDVEDGALGGADSDNGG